MMSSTISGLNLLDDADIAIFEMFECEDWSHEHRRVYILGYAALGQPSASSRRNDR